MVGSRKKGQSKRVEGLKYCKDVCFKWSVKTNKYSDGVKRCNTCERFIQCDDLRCPCCAVVLKCKPYGSRLRRRERAHREALEKNGMDKTCRICGKSYKTANNKSVACSTPCSIINRKKHLWRKV